MLIWMCGLPVGYLILDILQPPLLYEPSCLLCCVVCCVSAVAGCAPVHSDTCLFTFTFDLRLLTDESRWQN